MEVKKMSKPVEADFATFCKKLEEAYQSKTSCCVIFTTKDGGVGRVFFNEGHIIFLSFNNTRGNDVIPLLGKLNRISFRVARFMPILADSKLRDTPTLLKELSGQDVVLSASPAATHSSTGLSATQQKVIGEILNDIAGPMSDFFVNDYVVGASSLAEVVSNLSEELSNEDIETFKRELENRL